MFKLIGDKVAYIMSNDEVVIKESTAEDSNDCMIPGCDVKNVSGICVRCLRRVMSTERYISEVLPIMKKKYNVGNKKGCVQSDATKKRISDGMKRRWAERKQLSANSK